MKPMQHVTSQSAASMPAGFTNDGLSVGLQIIVRHLDDPLVLRVSACFERARPWFDRRPPVLDVQAQHSFRATGTQRACC